MSIVREKREHLLYGPPGGDSKSSLYKNHYCWCQKNGYWDWDEYQRRTARTKKVAQMKETRSIPVEDLQARIDRINAKARGEI